MPNPHSNMYCFTRIIFPRQTFHSFSPFSSLTFVLLFIVSEWNDFVTGKSRTWANTAINFLQYSKKVLVIYYEDLQTNLYENLLKIVNFLGLPVDENRLLCALGNPHGKFKRPTDKKKQLTFDPYSDEMREIVTLYTKAVSMALKLKDQQSLPNQYDPKLEL